MIEIPVKDVSKAMVEAFNECHDLRLNGYEVLFSSYDNGLLFIKLRHQRNGNVMSVKAKGVQLTIMRNGRIVKQVDF